jgi:hypothetical protein
LKCRAIDVGRQGGTTYMVVRDGLLLFAENHTGFSVDRKSVYCWRSTAGFKNVDPSADTYEGLGKRGSVHIS